MSDTIQPEFSYIVKVKDVSTKGKLCKLVATQEQCDALAKRFDLEGLKDFQANLEIKDAGKDQGVTLIGKLFATAYRRMGLSDDTSEVIVDDTINIRFLPESRITPELDEENMMTLDSEDLEPMPQDSFDLGELMAQYLALSVDPYLSDDMLFCAENLGQGVSINEPELARINPFEVLSSLKDKLKKD